MILRSQKHIILFVSLLLGCLFHGQAQKFTAFVDKKNLSLNEYLQVSFKVEGGQAREINYPNFKDFQIYAGPNTSRSMQIINGQVSQSVTHSFYLRPQKAGNLTIGGATVNIDGKTLSTKPISVTVVSGGQASANNTNTTNGPNNVDGSNTNRSQQGVSQDVMQQIKDDIFVRAIISKKNVYQGEQLSVTYKLYARKALSNVNMVEPPSYKNFWVEEIDTGNAQYKQEVYEGQRFNTAVIKKVILFPQRPGKLRIEPIKLEGNVKVVAPRSRRRQSIFDSFFDQYQEIPYTFSSPVLTINVSALPSSNRPTNFLGAVGKFSMKVEPDKLSTNTGEPVTLKIAINGVGNIKTLEEPKLEFPPDFDVFDPKINDKVSRSSGLVQGSKEFDYLVVPRNPGSYKLPRVSFSYFDLGSKAYKTLNSEEFVIEVTGEAQESSATPLITNKEDIELIDEDIRHIMTVSDRFAKRGSSFIASWGFSGLYALPILGFIFMLLLKQRKDKELADVAGTRSKRASRAAKKRLSIAEKLLAENNEKGFFKEISEAVWKYLGDKFSLGQSEFSRDQVGKLLGEIGVGEEYILRLNQLFDTCETALFAPSAVGMSAKEVYGEAEALITHLEDAIS